MTQTRLIIGSTAAKMHLPNWRVPKDLDVFSPDRLPEADTFWHESFEEWIPRGTDRVASLNELYTIKVSHAYWDLRNGSWNKHMSDLVALQHAGAKLDMALHLMLYKVWQEKHGAKKVNLQQEAGTFFKDAVVRKYEHDSIHASVAFGQEPMYIRTLKPGSSVMVDMAYIKAMPFQLQVKLYREEVFATALERIIIPSNYTASPRAAYAWALRRTITSLTKGWSARFLAENYETFRVPGSDYVARHKENMDKLIPLNEEVAA